MYSTVGTLDSHSLLLTLPRLMLTTLHYFTFYLFNSTVYSTSTVLFPSSFLYVIVPVSFLSNSVLYSFIFLAPLTLRLFLYITV